MMFPATYAERYNALPSLEEAACTFLERDALFKSLGKLFARYAFRFGVCLVHAHCQLLPGEAMVAEEYVTKPETAGPAYPTYWLIDGTPYEFSREAAEQPPEELFIEFRNIVNGCKVALGICYVGKREEILMERSEGRNNICEIHSAEAHPRYTETAWVPGRTPLLLSGCIRPGCVIREYG
jgi:hypothetical protein